MKRLADAVDASPEWLLGLDDTWQPSKIPAALRGLISFDKTVTPGDLKMLVRLNFRGKAPTTTTEWLVIWTVLKALCQEAANR